MNKKTRHYSPSWVNYLNGWIEHLPGLYWFYYLGLFLVLILLQVGVLWIEGYFPEGIIRPELIFLSIAIPYLLALMHSFDRRAGGAIAIMRPVLKTTDVEYEELEYRLTTLPGLITILAGFIGIGCQYLVEYFTGTYQIEEFAKFTASQYTFRILYMLLWFVFGTYIYHTIHQLRMIDLIYTRYTRINLFQMKTIYTFSNLSALTAFGMALLPIGFLLVNSRIMWSDPIVFIVVFIVQLIALLTFIWPQLGIHRQQTVEKERLLEEANQRYVAVINLLHKKVDTNSLENVNLISATLSSLEAELKRLEKIPTWPWQPETLRMLITALAFPLGLWLIQLLLQRLFIQ